MDLDRGVLARIDRRLLAGLSQDATSHMVRVPATEAKWATWKRYCDAAGLSMGRAIVTLIDRELVSVFGELGDDEVPVFAAETEDELTRREAAMADREGRLGGEEQRLRAWGERLRLWEQELQRREQQAEFIAKLAARSRDRPSKCLGSRTSMATSWLRDEPERL